MKFPWAKAPAPTVFKVFPLVRGMTLTIWRSKQDLREWLLKLWDDPNFQGLLDVARNSAPREITGNPAYDLGVREGYLRFLDTLYLATQPNPEPEPVVEANYGAGDIDNG